MMLDDESLLSAYLDDELEPQGRHRVELAILHDPGLARRLADLRRVRDLVAGLPRPAAPDDLALKVVVRIDQKRHYRTLLLATASLAIAASLFVQVALPYFERSTQTGIVADWGAALAEGTGRVQDGPHDPAPAEVAVIGAPTELAGPPRDAAVEARAREFLAVLDRPLIERFLVPVGKLDAATVDEIEGDVKNTVRQRPAYYRVDLGPEPAGPGRAVVFTLEATEPELSALVTRLSACPSLAGKISSEPADSRLLVAMRGVPGIRFAEGVQGAIISRIDPRLVDRFALREARGEGRSPAIPSPPPGEPVEPPDPRKLSTVLIWLVEAGAGDDHLAR